MLLAIAPLMTRLGLDERRCGVMIVSHDSALIQRLCYRRIDIQPTSS
ncbi:MULTISPECIES: hypothetical protein [Halomonadaceae]|nr:MULTISPECIES: hypothetical protein [Halomonas]QJQ94307.1 hypothetical protein HIO72_02755 [Halomonas sp. PA5]